MSVSSVDATQFFLTDDYELFIQTKTTFFANVAVRFTLGQKKRISKFMPPQKPICAPEL